MSKYTTEVRFICETLAGKDTSKGETDVESIIQDAAPQIFRNYEIFDENYRNVLNTKILRHFYTREIAFETIGLWKMKLNARMIEIMPYYNLMYKAMGQLDNVNLFDDTDIKTQHDGSGTNNTQENSEFNSDSTNNNQGHSHTDTKNDGTTSNHGTNNTIYSDSYHDDAKSINNNTSQTNSQTQTTNTVTHGLTVDTNQGTNTKNTVRTSDTPQGSITNIENNKYLSSATITDTTGSFDNNHTKTTNSGKDTTDTTSDYDKNQIHTTESSDGSDTKDGWKHSENDITTDDSGSTHDSGFSDTNTSNASYDWKKDTNELNRDILTTDEYLNHTFGKAGGKTYLELMGMIKDNLLNVDELILEDLEELFMQIW